MCASDPDEAHIPGRRMALWRCDALGVFRLGPVGRAGLSRRLLELRRSLWVCLAIEAGILMVVPHKSSAITALSALLKRRAGRGAVAPVAAVAVAPFKGQGDKSECILPGRMNAPGAEAARGEGGEIPVRCRCPNPGRQAQATFDRCSTNVRLMFDMVANASSEGPAIEEWPIEELAT